MEGWVGSVVEGGVESVIGGVVASARRTAAPAPCLGTVTSAPPTVVRRPRCAVGGVGLGTRLVAGRSVTVVRVGPDEAPHPR